ncbi:response regulator transcription factor [Solicola gregarius]|uniref:Response regulator transcription factor n=1 Tax=Solicola gregarius TaxID=2908642 RepID=A0AA46TFP5_9ACTN|nr:response regulator transcription factor [Solicola gregarius]UYM04456.1 response regulator transcription factor [Solicola gregarius]
MIKVLIVDDDALVRAGLVMILGGAADIEVVAEAGDGRECMKLVAEHRPDVVLMDIRMPRMDGLEATALIEQQPSPPKVIVLTTFDADDDVSRALRAGASGFLLKDTPPPTIVDAVHKVHEGEPMLSPKVTARLMRRIADETPNEADAARESLLSALSERELEVALAVGRGLSNAEIATGLHMSVATVKAHISRLFTKLDATNRVQIAILVHDAGLV